MEPSVLMGEAHQLSSSNMEHTIMRADPHTDHNTKMEIEPVSKASENAQILPSTSERTGDVPLSGRREQIRAEIASIWNGTHSKLLQQRRVLLKRQEEKILLAELWKAYQLGVAERLYQHEKAAAEREFEQQKNQIRDKMIQELLERKKKWIEEHQDITHVPSSLSQQPATDGPDSENNGGPTSSSLQRSMSTGATGASRKLRKRGLGGAMASDSQPLRVSERAASMRTRRNQGGPAIVTTLREFEVDEDLDLIRQNKNPGVATRRGKYAPAYPSKEDQQEDVEEREEAEESVSETPDNNSIHEEEEEDSASKVAIEQPAGRPRGRPRKRGASRRTAGRQGRVSRVVKEEPESQDADTEENEDSEDETLNIG
jgi:hypothetical protein